jgi:hypothetical protein
MRVAILLLLMSAYCSTACAQYSFGTMQGTPPALGAMTGAALSNANWEPPLPGPPPQDFVDLSMLADDQQIRSHKDGFFQKLSLTGTWLDRAHLDDVGITEVELFLATALPLPSREQPLVITPGFDMRSFEGPISPDLPETVYDAYLQFMWVPRWNEKWSAYLSVAPGVYSDFEQFNENAIRVVGRGIVRYEMLPGTLELLFGAMYLDRSDFNVLPAGGVVWMPWDGARYELLFPRPKVAWRFAQDPGLSEDWFYVSGEFGGDVWLVERAATVERMTMRDLRAIVGLERRKDGGAGCRLEVGYVFARSFEFDVSATEYEPDDTALVRFGMSY